MTESAENDARASCAQAGSVRTCPSKSRIKILVVSLVGIRPFVPNSSPIVPLRPARPGRFGSQHRQYLIEVDRLDQMIREPSLAGTLAIVHLPPPAECN